MPSSGAAQKDVQGEKKINRASQEKAPLCCTSFISEPVNPGGFAPLSAAASHQAELWLNVGFGRRQPNLLFAKPDTKPRRVCEGLDQPRCSGSDTIPFFLAQSQRENTSQNQIPGWLHLSPAHVHLEPSQIYGQGILGRVGSKKVLLE